MTTESAGGMNLPYRKRSESAECSGLSASFAQQISGDLAYTQCNFEIRRDRTASPAGNFPVRAQKLRSVRLRKVDEQRIFAHVELLRQRSDRLGFPCGAVGRCEK